MTDQSIKLPFAEMATLEERTSNGVSFGLTDEQKALRDLAHDFAEREIRPKEREYDEGSIHPADVIAKAHELGLMNVHIPEAYGGLELGAFEGMLIGEELCWGCAGIGTAIAANGLGHGPVIIAGTEEQKREWLPPLVDEVLLTSFALTEPNAGSDVSGIQTTAVRDGDDYIINGSKMFITNAGHAAWFTVWASTDKSQGHRGLTAFVVPSDLQGVVVDKHLDKMGQRSTDTSSLSFTDVRVPAANRLGEEGEGFKIAMKTLDFTRPGRRSAQWESRARRSSTRPSIEGAHPVRDADRDEPGDQLPDRRHGDEDRGVAAALLAGGVDDRQRDARDAAVLVREALRRGHLHGGHDRCGAGVRRLRVHEGVPGREADARRQAVPDLRGHFADPAARDRARASDARD